VQRILARGALGALALLLVSVSSLAGQAGSTAPAYRGGWALGLGLARQGVSDGLASPLRQTGSGFFVDGGYGRSGEASLWRIRLSYAAPTIGSGIENASGGFEDTHQAGIGFSWLRRFAAPAAGRLGLFFGGAVDVRVSVRSHHYDAREFGSRTETYGDLFVPAQLAGMWELDLRDAGRIRHRLAVPVVSFVMRSPWTGLKYAPSPSLAGPAKLTGFDSELEWRKRISPRWALAVSHRATLLRYPDPLPIAWIVQRVGLELERMR